MARAVQRRKLVSFLAHFGPPTIVWVIGAYSLYRATKIDGSLSEKAFLFGLALVVCATLMGSSRRSRQTTTRERALELQLQGMGQRLRAVEHKLDDLATRRDTENAAAALRAAACQSTFGSAGKPCMYVVTGNGNNSSGSTGEG